jgi:hypothetical protein
MSVITQSFGKVTILSERVFFESLSLSIGYNVLQLGEVADFEALTFNLELMLILKPNVQFSTEPAILPNCC